MYTENEIKEIIKELNKKTENIPNSIDTQDWIVLSALADAGKENAIMAIKYAYKLGILSERQTPLKDYESLNNEGLEILQKWVQVLSENPSYRADTPKEELEAIKKRKNEAREKEKIE